MAIIEFIQLGDYVKVSAIDEESGVEAVTILPTNLSQADMQEAALRKLKYVMEKKKSSGDDSGGFVV
jgi:hypothetical protein